MLGVCLCGPELPRSPVEVRMTRMEGAGRIKNRIWPCCAGVRREYKLGRPGVPVSPRQILLFRKQQGRIAW